MTDTTEQDINIPVGFESAISIAKGMGEAISSDPITGELKESFKPFTFPFSKPSYSTNLSDYEDKYDPEKKVIKEIKGYGVFAFDKNATPEQINNQINKIVLDPNREIKFQDLPYNTYLMDKYKNVYKAKYGKEFEGTNEEAAMAFMSEYNFINENLEFGLAKEFFVDIPRFDEQTQNDAGALFLGFQQVAGGGKGSRPFGVQFGETAAAWLASPSTYVGIGTLGVGFAAKYGAKKAAVKVTQDALINKYRNKILGSTASFIARKPGLTTVTAAGIEGGVFAGSFNALPQGIEIRTGLEEQQIKAGLLEEGDRGFDEGTFLVSTAFGIGLGTGIGGGAYFLGRKINKTIPQITKKDREKFSVEKLQEEVKARDLELPENLTSQQVVVNRNKVNKLKENDSIELFNEQGEKVSYKIESINKPEIYDFNKLGPKSEEARNKIQQQMDALNLGDDVSPQVKGSKEANIRNKVAKEYGLKKQVDSLGNVVTRKQKTFTLMDDAGNIKTVTTEKNGSIVSRIDNKKLTADDYRNFLNKQDEIEGIKEYNPINKAFAFLNRNFTSSFGLGKEVAELYRQQVSNLKATGFQIDKDINRFIKIWESERGKGSAKKLTKQEEEAIILAISSDEAFDLTKQPVLAALLRKNDGSKWKELQIQTEKMRDRIAKQTIELYNSGFIQKYKLDEEGNEILDEAGNKIETKFHEKLRKGSELRNYLTRQHRLYEDPSFTKLSLEKRYGDDLPAIKLYLKEQYGLKTDREIEDALYEIAKKSNKRQLTVLGQTSKRTVDSPMVGKILGQITDPLTVYANTVFKTSRIVQEYKFRDSFIQQGLNKNLEGRTILIKTDPKDLRNLEAKGFVPLEDEGALRGFALDEKTLQQVINQEQGVVSSVLNNPFEAIYVDPSFKKAYDNIMNFYDRDTRGIEQTMAMATFGFNVSQTVLSSATHFRNLYGGALQNSYNGVVPFVSRAWRKSVLDSDGTKLPKVGSPAFSLFKQAVPFYQKIKNKTILNERDERALVRLIELGMINNGVKAGIFREQYNILKGKGPNYIDDLERTLQKARETGAVKKATDTMNKLMEIYEMHDSINKIIAFEFEFGWLNRAFKQGKDTEGLRAWAKQINVPLVDEKIAQGKLGQLLEEAAAMEVKRYNPTYTELPNWLKYLRKAPLGNFVAFPMENIRNYHWSWRLAGQEVFSNNNVLRARGLLRAKALTASTLMTSGKVGGVTGLAAAIHGVTEEVLNAIQDPDVLPHYEVGLNKQLIGPIKTDPEHGRYIVERNFGYVDPLSFNWQLAQVAISSLHKDKDLAKFNNVLADAGVTTLQYLLGPFIDIAQGPLFIAKWGYRVIKSFLGDRDWTERDMQEFQKDLNRTFVPGVAKGLSKIFIPEQITSWGGPIDPVSFAIQEQVTGVKVKIRWLDIESGWEFKEQDNKSKELTSALSQLFNNPQSRIYEKDGKTINKEKATKAFTEWVNEQRVVQKRIFKEINRVRKIGIPEPRILDLASSIEKTIQATSAGASRYKAKINQNITLNNMEGMYWFLDMPPKIRSILAAERNFELQEIFVEILEKEHGKRIQLKGVQ